MSSCVLSQSQHVLQKKPREKLIYGIHYKNDPWLGKEYLKNQEEEREAAREAAEEAKRKAKKVNFASISKTTPKFGPPPSASRSKPSESSKVPRSLDRGYEPPHQSPRLAGKFQIIHLGTVGYPGEPIDVEEAKNALKEASISIQQIGVPMQALTNLVSQIVRLMNPRGEGDQNQQHSVERDDQGT